MTALSVTAASVVAGSDAVVEQGYAGATITAGQVVYKNSSDSRFALADADGASANIRTPYGIALHGASSGQPLAVQRSGSITIGATMTAGLAYYLGLTAGAIVPIADVTTGGYVSLIGVSTSTTVLKLSINSSGVVI